MQRRTIQEIADGASITKSLLSKIENGKSAPPVATLSRIAKSLGVSVSSLLEKGKASGTVFIPAAATRDKTKTAKGYEFFSFANGRPDKLMQIYVFDARKGKIAQQPLFHTGEEFVYVLKGRARYTVGSVQYTLNPGDALYFDSEQNHDFEPLTEEVKFLAVFCSRP
jgi:Cupin domain./Helix-turn-helix.